MRQQYSSSFRNLLVSEASVDPTLGLDEPMKLTANVREDVAPYAWSFPQYLEIMRLE